MQPVITEITTYITKNADQRFLPATNGGNTDSMSSGVIGGSHWSNDRYPSTGKKRRGAMRPVIKSEPKVSQLPNNPPIAIRALQPVNQKKALRSYRKNQIARVAGSAITLCFVKSPKHISSAARMGDLPVVKNRIHK